MERPFLFAAWGLVTLALGALSGRGDGKGTHAARAAEPKPASVPIDPESVGEPILQGSSIARSPGGARLYVADEATESIYVASEAATLRPALAARRVPLPGRPAQLVAFGQRVLVTVRHPGLLLSFRADAAAGLVEEHRVPLADDAWGLAVTEDHQTAVVTSAWTHTVTAVDLGKHDVRWSLDVAREPRAVALRPEGKIAYVSHLTSGTITSIDRIDTKKPIVHAIELPVAPLAAKTPVPLQASLGWALVMSADATRLHVLRRALGEIEAWQGTLSVDVLRTPFDAPLVPAMEPELVGEPPTREDGFSLPEPSSHGAAEAAQSSGVTVPRAAVLRRTTNTLLVASEGTAQVVELDARGLAPAMHRLHTYVLEGCAAPSGIVLSRDEATAFVHCAASFEVRRVVLRPTFEFIEADNEWATESVRATGSAYAKDPLGDEAARGRRLFADALDEEISGGFPCSGCHPEGRDDGHVWSEVSTELAPVGYGPSLQPRVLNASPRLMAVQPGVPRQTPMLAGRVAAAGPYGWTVESKTLLSRVERGMKLHRWTAQWTAQAPFTPEAHAKARAIVAFLRAGLVAPASKDGQLTTIEQRGKEIFEGSGQCAQCHATTADVSTLGAFKLPYVATPGFSPEPGPAFKAPALRFVSGTAPYLHDGSARSLEELVDKNDDRMGLTSQLDAEGRAALVAYLRTL